MSSFIHQYISDILINNENTSSGKSRALVKQHFLGSELGDSGWFSANHIQAVTFRQEMELATFTVSTAQIIEINFNMITSTSSPTGQPI